MKSFLFDRPLHPAASRLLHTGTGTLLAIQALLLLPDVALLYGAGGVVNHALLPALTFGIGLTDIVVWLAVGYIALATLLALGRLPWAGILVLLVVHAVWHTSGSAFSYGVDYLSASALFQFAAIMALLNVVAFHYAHRTKTVQPEYPSYTHPSPRRWAVWKRLHTDAGDTRKGG